MASQIISCPGMSQPKMTCSMSSIALHLWHIPLCLKLAMFSQYDLIFCVWWSIFHRKVQKDLLKSLFLDEFQIVPKTEFIPLVLHPQFE